MAYWNRFVTAFDLSNVDQDQWKLTLDWTPGRVPRLSASRASLKDNKYTRQGARPPQGRPPRDLRERLLRRPGGPRFTVFGDSEEVKYDSTHRVVGTSGHAAGRVRSRPRRPRRPTTTGTARQGPQLGVRRRDRLAGDARSSGQGLGDLLQDRRLGGPRAAGRRAGLGDAIRMPIGAYDDSKRTSFNVKGVYALTKTWPSPAGYAYEKYDVQGRAVRRVPLHHPGRQPGRQLPERRTTPTRSTRPTSSTAGDLQVLTRGSQHLERPRPRARPFSLAGARASYDARMAAPSPARACGQIPTTCRRSCARRRCCRRRRRASASGTSSPSSPSRPVALAALGWWSYGHVRESLRELRAAGLSSLLESEIERSPSGSTRRSAPPNAG